MRAGACTVQQTLTSEAASVLRHSLGLAKRRGHAQVTPLHVAATLLSPRCSLLRRACLKSHPHSTSHPLQCRALELCFNVALNRLPTTPGPFLHGQPSLSNALIAALKRAQAHQRRGCIEQQQQQPLLAIKVALEQLIISILDDPSVSRVMREAGFSSTSVKNNLEDVSASSVFQCYSSSGGILSSTCSPPIETHREISNHSSFWQTHLLNCYSEQNPLPFSTPKKPLSSIFTDSATEKEDFRLVLEVLMRTKRRNTVIVGDSVSTTEGLVAELMGKVERGEIPDELRSAHFIKFQLSSVSLRFMKREDMELKVADLRRKVGSLVTGGEGAIIYAGDLKWVVEGGVGEKEGGFSAEVCSYNATDHLVAEIGRLLSDYSCSNSKVWLMAIANYQTYMRCQTKQPSLETQWTLQAVSVPSGGLGLSLHASNALDSKVSLSPNTSLMPETKPFTPNEEPDSLTCCADCISNFEKEAAIFTSGQQNPSSYLLSSCNSKDMVKGPTNLPYWLQPYKADTHHKDDLVELKKRWNRLCHSLHHPRPNQILHQKGSSLFNNQNSSGKSYTYSKSYPWWPSSSQYNQTSIFPESTSISFTESITETNHVTSIASQLRSHQSRTIEFGFTNEEAWEHRQSELSSDFLKNMESQEVKTTLALGNPLFSDSMASKVQKREGKMDPKRDLCKLLQENIPWQSAIIPSIAEALIGSSKLSEKNGNWFLIRGMDCIGKRRLALATAESICGSTDHLVHLNKRRENKDPQLSEILIEALKENPKCVVLLEDIDYADSNFIKFLADGLKTKNFKDMEGGEVCFDQATFIATIGGSGSSGSSSFINSKEDEVAIQMKLQFEEDTTTNPAFEIFNSDHKRKAEWDLPFNKNNKHPRKEEKEHSSSSVEDINGGDKGVISRQSSSNTFDLNIRAEEEEEDDNSNPIPSDLTQETATDLHSPHGYFLGSIEKSFLFDQNPKLFDEMGETFLSKIKGSFHEVCRSEMKMSLSVDKVVLDEMVAGCGSFLDSLFEIWLKDIFQTSLEKVVKERGKEGNIKLSLLGAKEENILDYGGFKGSSLPKTVQVVFKDLATGFSM
ncbi:protein SMAX1-LIKE 4-like isoform X2 [Telopea speciosissima]|uniref:protein SMAX1-LIKE 4-like isoform X2 n=1 Tax=Telopea speciosissima TaxID=54955 RepID=UPI001CC4F819|nr:protein SMAX1-LIKE 4-like isoform X2 [Telopea speciosissima]